MVVGSNSYSQVAIPHEVPIRDLCRREGICPNVYYAWLKDFMEAGKERMTRDTVCDTTRAEVDGLKGENERLKQLVADLSLSVRLLKNRGTRSGVGQRRRTSISEKARVLAVVAASPLSKRQALAEMGILRRMYYNWVRR